MNVWSLSSETLNVGLRQRPSGLGRVETFQAEDRYSVTLRIEADSEFVQALFAWLREKKALDSMRPAPITWSPR